MGLADAMRLASQYGQPRQGVDLQPMPGQQAAPMMNFQPPPMMDTSPNPWAKAGGALGSYMKRRSEGNDDEGGQSSGVQSPSAQATPSFAGPSMRGYARGGRWDEDLGEPVVVGEQGPEVVVPQTPATVVPNPATRERWAGGQPPTPESSGITGDASQTRSRIHDFPQFLRGKIQDELSTPQGPVWGSGAQSTDADGNVIKAPGRKHGALIGALEGARAGMQATGDWRGAAAGALTGLGIGGIKPEFAQMAQQRSDAQRDQGNLDILDKNQASNLSAELKKAQTASQYGGLGVKQGMLGVAQQRADTGDQRADEYVKRTGIAQQNADTSAAKAKVYATKAEADTAFKERRIREPHVKVVQDPETGGWSVINTDRETGVSTASSVSGANGQFKTTAPHLMGLEKIKASAAAAESKATTTEAKKAASDKVYAEAFGNAVDSYKQQASEAESRGDTKGAARANQMAIKAETEARKRGWTPPVVHRPR